MIRRLDVPNLPATRRRAAFTLLEVLVVVAIILILATVSTIYIFRYLEDANVDTAKQQMLVLEQAAKNYMTKSNGRPPASLEELVTPQNGQRPFVEGGPKALINPWGDAPYVLSIGQNQFGDPDPQVTTQHNGQTITALGR